ncbi:hypothetical protein J6590_034698 [Homalodisca vitripennis]|nr:hypothetical protein J6590_094184 [Homalodisca vitripennis]KAG8302385.1 hypothetical protein J6590_034698 [Homalodisca vitripennis]
MWHPNPRVDPRVTRSRVCGRCYLRDLAGTSRRLGTGERVALLSRKRSLCYGNKERDQDGLTNENKLKHLIYSLTSSSPLS